MLVTLLDIAWQKNNVEPSRQQLFKVIKSYLGQSMDHSEQPVSLSQRSGEISVGSVLVKVDSSSSTQDSSTSKEVVVSWTHSDELLGSKLLNLTQNYCMGQNRWHQKTRQVKVTDLESTLDSCFHLLLKSSWIYGMKWNSHWLIYHVAFWDNWLRQVFTYRAALNLSCGWYGSL